MWTVFLFAYENIFTELFVFYIVKFALSKLILTDDCAAYLKTKCQYEYKFYLLNERNNDVLFVEKFCTISILSAFIIFANMYVVAQLRYIEPGPVLSLFLSSHVINLLYRPSVFEFTAVALYAAFAFAKSRIIIFFFVFDALEKVHINIKHIHSLHELVVVERDTPIHEYLVLFILWSTKLNKLFRKVRLYVIVTLISFHIYLNQVIHPSPKDYLILGWLCYQFSV